MPMTGRLSRGMPGVFEHREEVQIAGDAFVEFKFVLSSSLSRERAQPYPPTLASAVYGWVVQDLGISGQRVTAVR